MKGTFVEREFINGGGATYLVEEMPLSVFQRRAAQVKRESMLDHAVRLVIQSFWSPVEMLPAEMAEEWAAFRANDIRAEFAKLQGVAP